MHHEVISKNAVDFIFSISRRGECVAWVIAVGAAGDVLFRRKKGWGVGRLIWGWLGLGVLGMGWFGLGWVGMQ